MGAPVPERSLNLADPFDLGLETDLWADRAELGRPVRSLLWLGSTGFVIAIVLFVWSHVPSFALTALVALALIVPLGGWAQWTVWMRPSSPPGDDGRARWAR